MMGHLKEQMFLGMNTFLQIPMVLRIPLQSIKRI